MIPFKLLRLKFLRFRGGFFSQLPWIVLAQNENKTFDKKFLTTSLISEPTLTPVLISQNEFYRSTSAMLTMDGARDTNIYQAIKT